jgi:hypothetical protein
MLFEGSGSWRTTSFGKGVLTSGGLSTLPRSTFEGNTVTIRSTIHVRDAKRRSEQGEAIQS